MSSILKALKKLENENNARTPDAIRINAEILRGGDSKTTSLPVIIITALVVFLCGSVATYLYMKPGVNKSANVISPTPTERIVPSAIVPSPPAIRPPQATIPDTSRQPSAVQMMPKEKQKVTPVPPSPSKLKTEQRISLPQLKAIPPQSAPAATQVPENPVVSARPIVRVNGIAYQDGSESVAVINGIPVSKGGVVEGVMIEEIQRDRVKFSFGGEKFEVNLGKSNQ